VIFLSWRQTLAHIKSRMLLPPDPSTPENEEQEDPRMELVQQLLEYKKYKVIADQLKDLESVQTKVWPRGAAESQETVELLEVSIFDLIQAISGVFSRLGKTPVTEIKADTVRVELEMERIVELLQHTKTVQFQDLFKGVTMRIKVIGIFLAILELVRSEKSGYTRHRYLAKFIYIGEKNKLMAQKDTLEYSIEGVPDDAGIANYCRGIAICL